MNCKKFLSFVFCLVSLSCQLSNRNESSDDDAVCLRLRVAVLAHELAVERGQPLRHLVDLDAVRALAQRTAAAASS